MCAEAIKVIVRCRPLDEREKSLNCKSVVFIESSRGQCSICHPTRENDIPKNFFFDGAYGPTSTTEHIYADIVYPLVEGVTEGYNGTIFAYGQTGCGKSFTMQGYPESTPNKGIIPRSFEHVFETAAVSSDVKFLIHASYLEIYNEEILDLLGVGGKTKCDIKEHPERGVFVNGLSMHKVKSVNDCRVIMDQGWRNRATGSTLMNADSSRSHSIFTIYLEMICNDADTGREMLRAGKLNLVDLAGSERQSKTGAVGDRLKEATKINLSLSALGNVISALVDANTKHVPYRDSKLTRLLQDSLGGNTKTLMIACLSPADNNYEESLSTLRYANRAKNIKNKPVINEDPKDALLRQYKEEIARLKSMLEGKAVIPPPTGPELVGRLQSTHSYAKDLEVINREKEALKTEYESKLREKEALYAAEAANSAKLQEDLQRLRELYESKLQVLDNRARAPTESTDKKFHLTSAAVETTEASDSLVLSDSPILPNRRPSEYDTLPTLRLDNLHVGSRKDGESDAAMSAARDGGLSAKTYRIGESQRMLDEVYKPMRPQFAVHLATTSLSGVTTPLDGISGEYDKMTKEDLLRRLHLLEEDMVGGEQANNKDFKERHSKRKRHAEERKRLLAEANKNLEDDGIMVGIYESIQDELRHKNRLLNKERQKNQALDTEIRDLQCEFEREREDYLEAIRKQSRHISLLQAILERMQPCIRRDSNYANIDKIKKQAFYDEDTGDWILPALTVERTTLPLASTGSVEELGGRAGAHRSGTSMHSSPGKLPCARDLTVEKEEEDRLYAKLASRAHNHTNYFANKRKEQLLLDAAFVGSNRKPFLQSPANGDKSPIDGLGNNPNSQCIDRDSPLNGHFPTRRNPPKAKSNFLNKNPDLDF